MAAADQQVAPLVSWRTLRVSTGYAYKKRWLIFVGATAVLLVLRRRRRKALEEAAAQQDVECGNISAEQKRRQGRPEHERGASCNSLDINAKKASHRPPLRQQSDSKLSQGTADPMLYVPRPLQKTFAWNQKKIDIGAVLGMDIGGTLCKLMFFEKRPPPAPQEFYSNDPLASNVSMKRTVSLGNLHETEEQQAALQEFYKFMNEPEHYGETGVRDEHLQFYSYPLGGQLHFFRFETRHMDHAVDLIASTTIHHNIKALGCTGGGAYKFEELFRRRLGVKMIKVDEMACLVRGLQFCLANEPGECYTYKPEPEKASDVDVDLGNLPAGRQDTFRNMRMRHMSKIREKVEYAFKVQRSSAALLSGYPALIVSIGSGVSILKVDGPSKFERVSGSSIGGGTYWGLCRLLTKAATYDDSLDLASVGDSDKIDMLVRDIYGQGYNKFQLSSDTLASSFGKLVSSEQARDNVHEADLAKALCVMITMNIGQVAYLNAKLYDTRRIYFVGNFLRHNKISARRLSFAIDYWSGGEMEALFFEHEGYLGSLGAFLMSGVEEKATDSDPDSDG